MPEREVSLRGALQVSHDESMEGVHRLLVSSAEEGELVLLGSQSASEAEATLAHTLRFSSEA